jgi:putative membrane protein
VGSIIRTTMKLAVGICLFTRAAGAGAPPETADVLNRLHRWNLTQIEAGKLAQDNGHGPATKSYGKMLVADHTSADQKVVALAKDERIDLSASEPVVGASALADLTAGPRFDKRFARSMLDDQKKNIATLTEARDSTTDGNLKKLLATLLPTLQKHEQMAEGLESAK